MPERARRVPLDNAATDVELLRMRRDTAPAIAATSSISRLQRNAGNRATGRAIQRWLAVTGQIWDIETIGKPPDNWFLAEKDGKRVATDKTPEVVKDALANLNGKKAVNKFIAEFRAGKIKLDDAAPVRTVTPTGPPPRSAAFPPPNTTGVFTVDPTLVRFSQDSIGSTLTNGTPLDEFIDDLKAGRVDVSKVPPIQVVEWVTKGGAHLFMSIDNRRLYCFREAGIPIRCVFKKASTLSKHDRSKITGGPYGTDNIRVRD